MLWDQHEEDEYWDAYQYFHQLNGIWGWLRASSEIPLANRLRNSAQQSDRLALLPLDGENWTLTFALLFLPYLIAPSFHKLLYHVCPCLVVEPQLQAIYGFIFPDKMQPRSWLCYWPPASSGLAYSADMLWCWLGKSMLYSQQPL